MAPIALVYNLTERGIARIEILIHTANYTTVPINGSPWESWIRESSVSPAHCRFYTMNGPNGTMTEGDKGVIRIDLRDRFGNQFTTTHGVRSDIKVVHSESQRALNVSISSSGGDFIARFNASIVGRFLVSMLVENTHIPGSPFTLTIIAKRHPHVIISRSVQALLIGSVVLLLLCALIIDRRCKHSTQGVTTPICERKNGDDWQRIV
jgi:hypothetical protein